MDGREFLPVARELAAGPTEAHWRAAVGRAYYALFLEMREALVRWGVAIPPKQNVHAFVRLKLVYAKDADLKTLGMALDELGMWRNSADYDLRKVPLFNSDKIAWLAVTRAENAVALLDAVEADPTRRAAAVASLPP
jgi:hypothetical protein